MAAPTLLPRSTFWPAFWLGVALFATKIYRVFPPGYLAWEEFDRYFREIAMVGAADLLFALVVGLSSQAILSSLAQRPRIHRLAFRLFVGFCTISVVYAVVSMGLYDVLHMPLTYPLLCIGADIGNMRSSVTSYVTPGFLSTLVILPSVYLAFTLLSERYLRFDRTRYVRGGQAFGIAAVVGSCMVAQDRVGSEWGTRYHMPKLWDNPHYDLVSSWVSEMFRSDAASASQEFPAGNLREFEPATKESCITPDLKRGPKNVIVIVGESVGAHYLSLYGNKLDTWPQMQAEAKHSLVFSNYYSQIENTSDALFSLTLSRHAPLTWRNATMSYPREPGTTMAQILKAHNYRTAFISGGDNKYAMQDQFLADRGYDRIEDCHDAQGASAFSWGLDDKSTFDMLLKFIDADPKKPFYIFAWTQATHHPFYVPPAYAENDFINDDASLGDVPIDLNNYLNSLAELDRQLARFLQALRDRGLDQDTIVAITGDHGQAFGAPHKAYFHSGNVYQEDVHVPLMIWSPALFKDSPPSSAIGAHLDLAPTLLDLVGIPSPAGWQGHSLLETERHERRAYFFGMRNDYIFGLREGQFKYVFNSTQGRDELYDLENDPTEQNNLSPGQSELRQRLHGHLAAWMHSQKVHPAGPSPIQTPTLGAMGSVKR